MEHELWWKGPPWLVLPESEWPSQYNAKAELNSDEEHEVCHLSYVALEQPLVHAIGSLLDIHKDQARHSLDSTFC